MKYDQIVKEKIDTLIQLILTDGVSPADLADNIFIDYYTDIRYYKRDDRIIGELIFHEDTELIKMIYTYNVEKRLLLIEEEVDGRRSTLWDREEREKELLDEILELLHQVYNEKQLEKFIDSLPEELKTKILQKVA